MRDALRDALSEGHDLNRSGLRRFRPGVGDCHPLTRPFRPFLSENIAEGLRGVVKGLQNSSKRGVKVMLTG